MEATDMARQEDARHRGMFGIGTPPKERTATPVLPRPDVKPVLEPEKPEPSKRSLRERLAKVLKNRLVQRLALSTAVLTGGSALGYEAYQNIPAVHQAVDHQFLERIVLKTPEVPSFFDNKIDNQIVKAGVNATPVSQEEFLSLSENSIKPLEKGKFPDVSVILLIKLKDGQSVNIQTDWVKNAYNPIDPESKDPVAYGKIFTIAKKGTEIITPEAGNVSISTKNVDEKDYVDDLVVIFNGPDNTVYNLVIIWPDDIRQVKPTDIINKTLAEGKNNVDLPATTSIGITNANNVKLKISMFAYPIGYTRKLGIPVNFSLIEKEVNGQNVVAFIPQQ